MNTLSPPAGVFIAALWAVSNPAIAEEPPLHFSFTADELEYRHGHGSDYAFWNGQAWLKSGRHGLGVKAEGTSDENGVFYGENQLLYSYQKSDSVSFFMGGRRVYEPKPNRYWGVLGVAATTANAIDLEANLFLGNSGRFGVSLEAVYDWALNDQLFLSSKATTNLFTKRNLPIGHEQVLRVAQRKSIDFAAHSTSIEADARCSQAGSTYPIVGLAEYRL